MRRALAGCAVVLASGLVSRAAAATRPSPLDAEIDRRAAAVEAEMLTWRRHLHQNPELSNREERTAQYVAERLRSFGLEPQTGIARTGVTALIKGGRPGPVVALRADMDALPVKEEVDLPFASRATGEYEGKPVPVMHACGHDAHMAILLAAARVLTEVRAQLPGSVRLLFQPAEEGAPAGESPAGADAMVQAGLLKDPKVDAIFGLHVIAPLEAGILFYRAGPMMAAADRFEIVVEGRQTHGSTPWRGVDPIVVGAQIVAALQTVVSRQVDITKEPAVVSVGQFEAGVRNNIIPDRARLVGTIRTFDTGMQADIHERVRKTAEGIAAAAGATVKVTVARGYPPVDNDVALTERMRPTLERTAPGRVRESRKITGAEDFSFFQREAPGMYLFLGITPPAQLETAASNHSPRFFVEESALSTGLRALVHLTADYLAGAPAARH